jgi:hypothetical protein
MIEEITKRFMNNPEQVDENELAALFRADVGYLLGLLSNKHLDNGYEVVALDINTRHPPASKFPSPKEMAKTGFDYDQYRSQACSTLSTQNPSPFDECDKAMQDAGIWSDATKASEERNPILYRAIEIYDDEIRYDGKTIWKGAPKYKTPSEVDAIIEAYEQSAKTRE